MANENITKAYKEVIDAIEKPIKVATLKGFMENAVMPFSPRSNSLNKLKEL
jgi:hypothetical protein